MINDFKISLPDNITLACRSACNNDSLTAGTIIILQDYGESYLQYDETIFELNKRGFTCLTFDWFGQGNSSKYKNGSGREANFDINQDINHLDHFLKTVAYPDYKPPYFLLGIGMGAMIALAAQELLTNQFERILLLSPSFALPVSSAQQSQNPSSSQTTRQQSLLELQRTNSDLFICPPHAKALRQLKRLASYCEKEIKNILVPTLLILSGSDYANAKAARFFARNMRLADSLTIMGATKNLLQANDMHYRQFWAAFDAFIPMQQTQ